MEAAGAAAIATTVADAKPAAAEKGLPKICLEAGMSGQVPAGASDEVVARRLRQLGVEHALSGGGPIPWDETQLKERIARLKANGIALGNLMIGGFNRAIYARPGRDEEIDKVIQSIRAAGKAGLPVVEYNWYAHRAMEGRSTVGKIVLEP